MYELNEQELASVVGGSYDTETEITKSFNKSFNKNKIIVKNKITIIGDYSTATAVNYIQSPEIYATSHNE